MAAEELRHDDMKRSPGGPSHGCPCADNCILEHSPGGLFCKVGTFGYILGSFYLHSRKTPSAVLHLLCQQPEVTSVVVGGLQCPHEGFYGLAQAENF